ncbi:hypothetical protein K6119_10675 [Paracrocinitomix mangrovi]|uniref:hypothetical protein n=1 Tax=Paracrocinitomix mangrovi TaxID=2862509 RepID=UPI001C8D3AF9|nr:hypothetical protein [Paracrocinitomix mangrovi]UKN00196.1 hypothetical protein K6119_10675 [Paracrocinitomix mangrovi]
MDIAVLAFYSSYWNSIGEVIYAFLAYLGYTFFPSIIGVGIYLGITKLIKNKNQYLELIIRVIIFGIIVQLALWIWAMLEIFIDHKFNELLKRTAELYEKYYQDFIPVAILIGLTIPLTEFLYAKTRVKNVS